MNSYQQLLAENCYGYGDWKAKFWFIGLEERLAPWENGSYQKRAAVFESLNHEGLCDCHDFHLELGERVWHIDPAKPQKTWQRLIRLFNSYRDEPTDDASVLHYQQAEWGRMNRKILTCVTELDGLPFDSSKQSNPLGRAGHPQKEIERIRGKRIEFLKSKLQKSKPRLVVLYGKTQKKYWEMLIGQKLICDEIISTNGTNFAFIPHPNIHGRTNAEWDELAKAFSNAGVGEQK